jgi:hypothetical protein
MYITGVSACGKSTLLDELDESGFLGERSIIIGTYAYGSGIFPFLGTNDYVGLQRYVYHQMIAQHLVYCTSPSPILLDRSPIDWECYTQMYMETGMLRYMDVAGMQAEFRLELDLDPKEIRAILIDPPLQFVKNNLVARKDWGKYPWASDSGLESLIWEYQTRWQILAREGADVLVLKTTDLDERISKAEKKIKEWIGR